MKSTFFKFLLVLILLISTSFRLQNVNWDNNNHLHPDERFLTMVGVGIQFPENIFNYLDPKISTLNPRNNNNSFFVYGLFPISLNKFIAQIFNNDNYNNYAIQGRILASIFDLLIILYIFKTIELLEKKYKLNQYLKYWASLIYGCMVLPIQLSHFFTNDIFLNFFMFVSFYYSLKYKMNKKKIDFFFSASMFALAIASKITALFILPLNLILLINKKIEIKKLFKNVFAYILITYSILRFADPYMFETSNFLYPKINNAFIQNLIELNSYSNRSASYPPGIQWLSKKPFIHSFVNKSFFGTGIIIFSLFIIGIFFIFKKYRKKIIILPLIWSLLFFLYQSLQFVQTTRYFIIIYPFIAIYSGFGALYLLSYIKKENNNKLAILVLTIFILVWPIAFSSVYKNLNSRIKASQWVHANLKNNSIILSEHWDDALPFSVEGSNKIFTIKQLPVFDPDDIHKWIKMNNLLNEADYFILSSNRGWGSIKEVPKKYPIMSKFYEDLLTNNTQYIKIKEFTSFPTIKFMNINIEIDDTWADESFTVYDHPKVMIFKNRKLGMDYISE